jgi:hypothetical protein
MSVALIDPIGRNIPYDLDLNCSDGPIACIFAVAAGTAASTQERLFFAVEVIRFFPFDHNAIRRR